MSGSHEEELARLRAQNAALQRECDRLNSRFGAPAEQGPLQAAAGGGAVASDGEATAVASPASWDGLGHGLTKDQIARYSRQIVLHSFGVQGAHGRDGRGGPCERCAPRARRSRQPAAASGGPLPTTDEPAAPQHADLPRFASCFPLPRLQPSPACALAPC